MKKTILLIAPLLIFLTISLQAQQFGKELTETEEIKISVILENPEDFIDENVLVKGEILDVCPMMGCWMDIAGDKEGEKIRVKVNDGDIVFPVEAKGDTAMVEGKIYKIELNEEDAVKYYEHQAEEKGEEFDPETITGPVVIYQIKGEGAVISKKEE